MCVHMSHKKKSMPFDFSIPGILTLLLADCKRVTVCRLTVTGQSHAEACSTRRVEKQNRTTVLVLTAIAEGGRLPNVECVMVVTPLLCGGDRVVCGRSAGTHGRRRRQPPRAPPPHTECAEEKAQQLHISIDLSRVTKQNGCRNAWWP
jgi:hypothetical protein